MDNQQFDNGIRPNPFEKLNETELMFLLEHNGEQLTEAQKLDIQAKLNSFQVLKGNEKKQDQPFVQKVYTKTMPQHNRKAGYVNIIILMLTVWLTCLCGMAYIYSQLNIMG